MSTPSLEQTVKALAQQISFVLGYCEGATKYTGSESDPVIVTLSATSLSPKQKEPLKELLRTYPTPGWERKKIRVSANKIRGGWKFTATMELFQRRGSPKAVELTNRGDLGQEKDPHYPI